MQSLAITRDTHKRHRAHARPICSILEKKNVDRIAGQVQIKQNLLRIVSLKETSTGPPAIEVTRSAIKIQLSVTKKPEK